GAVQERGAGTGAGDGAGAGAGRRGAEHQGAAGMTGLDVAVIDYGAGHLGIARWAMEELGFAQRRVQGPREIPAEGPILLPGVGNYGAADRKSTRLNSS